MIYIAIIIHYKHLPQFSRYPNTVQQYTKFQIVNNKLELPKNTDPFVAISGIGEPVDRTGLLKP